MLEIFKTKTVSKNAVIVLLLISLFLSLSIAALVFFDYYRVKKVYPDGTINNGEVIFAVDDISEDEFSFTISSWQLKRGEEIKAVKNYILLKDKTEDYYLMINTELVRREDLKEAFANDNIDYSNSGSFAKVSKRHLKKGHEYDLFVWYLSNNSNIIVPLGKSLYNNGGSL